MSKSIYTFTIDKVAKVSEKRTEKYTDDSGEEKERTITEEVEKTIPIEILIKKPNRKQIQEADMVYSIEMSRCIKLGILTKNMLLNKYTDTGGLVSKEDNKVIDKAKTDLIDMEEKLVTLVAVPREERSEELRSEIKNLELDIVDLRKRLVETQASYLDLFNNTADSKAQSRAVMWYVLNMSFYKDTSGGDDFKPLFIGDTFDDKEEYSYTLEESGNFIYDNAYGKIARVVSFWYFTGTEDVTLLEASLKGEEIGGEEVEEVEDKVDEPVEDNVE